VSIRCLHITGVLLLAGLALSCDNNEAPKMNEGEVVLRFNPAAGPTMPAMRASVFDSVVVNVYRGGAALTREVSHGVGINNDNPISIPVSCIAENGKRVGVDLFIGRTLAYHGHVQNVNVAVGKTTAVSVDVSKFLITDLTLAPQIVASGAAFTLRWPSAPAAASYVVEQSTTADFATIAAWQTAPDTTLAVHVGAGTHYFRVRPVTPYAQGTPSPERFGYVTGGGNQVKVTAVSDAVIPLETIVITGENLDFPGTQALMGADTLSIESTTWGKLIARVPRPARTNKVTVTSPLGTNVSGKEVTVQRIAYVTAFPASTTTTGYVTQIESHRGDVQNSGVAAIDLSELDRRDMSVFDVIVVANDTGTLQSNWGGTNQAQRINAIADSGANVLAIGRGGVSFLQNTITSQVLTYTASIDNDRKYYEPNKDAPIFHTPHGVAGPDLTFCNVASTTVALDISSSSPPAGTSLYACTAKVCVLTICSANDQWALADFHFDNAALQPVIYLFWGYGGLATDLSADGKNCLANAVYMLYQ
jgi:hypothetical protein